MKFVVESITPATSTLPSGSLTSFHTFHSCSWRGLAPAMTRPAGRAWVTTSAMSLSGRSRWGGAPGLAQQTRMRLRAGGVAPEAEFRDSTGHAADAPNARRPTGGDWGVGTGR